MPAEGSTGFADIVDRMVVWAIGRDDVRALWVEGDAAGDVRRPYPALRLHVAADEPEFPPLVDALPGVIGEALGATLLSAEDAIRWARELRFRMPDGRAWTLIAERTSMLAKRPRAHVAPLLDRTHHLTHVMDFSRRREREGRG